MNGRLFKTGLPLIGIHQARKQLWARLITRHGQTAVLRHRKMLAAAVNNIINTHIATTSPYAPCCCCGRTGKWRQFGEGRRPFCDACWSRHLEFVSYKGEVKL